MDDEGELTESDDADHRLEAAAAGDQPDDTAAAAATGPPADHVRAAKQLMPTLDRRFAWTDDDSPATIDADLDGELLALVQEVLREEAALGLVVGGGGGGRQLCNNIEWIC